MIVQFAFLFGFLAMGELLVYLTGAPIPASIIGMLLLAFSLKAGWLKEDKIDKVATFFVNNLGFFFVPAGVGVMNCFGLISKEWMPIVFSSIISTFIIIAVTGWTHQVFRTLFKRHHGISAK